MVLRQAHRQKDAQYQVQEMGMVEEAKCSGRQEQNGQNARDRRKGITEVVDPVPEEGDEGGGGGGGHVQCLIRILCIPNHFRRLLHLLCLLLKNFDAHLSV